MLVHQTVMDPTNFVVARITRRDDGASESRPKLLYLFNRQQTHATPFPGRTASPRIELFPRSSLTADELTSTADALALWRRHRLRAPLRKLGREAADNALVPRSSVRNAAQAEVATTTGSIRAPSFVVAKCTSSNTRARLPEWRLRLRMALASGTSR